MRFLSSSGPPAPLTAAAMSAVVTEPNSRPSLPARASSETDSFSRSFLISRAWPRSRISRGVARALDLHDLLLGALGPGDGGAARDEEVAAVAVGDLDDVAGQAEPGDLTGEDELHGRPPQRAVEV